MNDKTSSSMDTVDDDRLVPTVPPAAIMASSVVLTGESSSVGVVLFRDLDRDLARPNDDVVEARLGVLLFREDEICRVDDDIRPPPTVLVSSTSSSISSSASSVKSPLSLLELHSSSLRFLPFNLDDDVDFRTRRDDVALVAVVNTDAVSSSQSSPPSFSFSVEFCSWNVYEMMTLLLLIGIPET